MRDYRNNEEIDSLEFLDDGKIKVYFIGDRSKIVASEVGNLKEREYIKEYLKNNNERRYSRLKIRNAISWHRHEDSVAVPKTAGHQLESIAIQIKNILNQKK